MICACSYLSDHHQEIGWHFSTTIKANASSFFFAAVAAFGWRRRWRKGKKRRVFVEVASLSSNCKDNQEMKPCELKIRRVKNKMHIHALGFELLIDVPPGSKL